MKLKLSLTIAVVLVTVIFSCKKNPEVTGSNKIEIGQTTTDNISYTSVEASTIVSSLGGNSITQHGHCWSTESEPTIQDSKTSLGELTQPTTYKSEISELLDNTTYYIRSYLTYTNGTVYGTEQSITTLKSGKPTVNTNEVSNVTLYSAQCGGVALADSGLFILSKGICWDTSAVFAIESNLGMTNDGDSLGIFVSQITGLQEGVNYNVKAYATNAKGTSYGEVKQFSTVAITLPGVNTSSPTNVTANSAESGGDVTDEGNGSVTERGICWSISSNPTLTDNHSSDGSGTGIFESSVTGLSPTTQYYTRAYATNSAGTAYGNEISFTTLSSAILPTVLTQEASNISQTTAISGGNVTSDGGGTVSARGICWSTSATPTLSDSHTIDGTGTGLFTSNIEGLTQNTSYYVRAYATNAEGTAYGNEITFTTISQIVLPTVTTDNATNITTTKATCGGEVTNDGGADVTAIGVCWSISPNPTLSDNYTTNGIGTGTFTSNLFGLTQNTYYYVRAYATNSEGTAYGNEITFTTLPETSFLETFVYDLGLWSAYNVIGEQVWEWADFGNPPGCAKANGYAGGPIENEDWLISPEYNLENYSNVSFRFDHARNYATNDGLFIMISIDYTGSGDPNSATWQDITSSFVFPDPGTWDFIDAGTADITNYCGNTTYISFLYTSTDNSTSTWEVDNAEVIGVLMSKK